MTTESVNVLRSNRIGKAPRHLDQGAAHLRLGELLSRDELCAHELRDGAQQLGLRDQLQLQERLFDAHGVALGVVQGAVVVEGLDQAVSGQLVDHLDTVGRDSGHALGTIARRPRALAGTFRPD